MTTITRKFEFDSGHRVLGHEGKCRHLHGHRYVAEVTIDAPELDHLSMVVDFSVVKRVIGDWINHHWDHNLLLNRDDPFAQIETLEYGTDESTGNKVTKPELITDFLFGGRIPYVMPEGNPTAENIAAVLFKVSTELLREAGYEQLLVRQVRVYETPNCWADAFTNAVAKPANPRVRTMFDKR